MKRRFTVKRSPPTGAQAVQRALAILKVVGGERTEWKLSAVAAELKLHKTTVLRLLRALEAEGMVARDPDTGLYRLGPELLTLSARSLRANNLRTVARRELEALTADTGETTTLEILLGNEVLILDEVQGRYLVGSKPEVGTRWPAHTASTGKVLLAAERYEEHPGEHRPFGKLVRLTPRTITSPVRLERELARAWKQGFATAIGEVEPGFVAVGATVRNHEGRVIAALSVGGPKNRMTPERIAQLSRRVRRSARHVSTALGAPPPRGTAVSLRNGRATARAVSPTPNGSSPVRES